MADVGVLVAGDANAFEALLQALMAAENDQRARAELVLNELKKHPDACISQLIRSLRTSSNQQSRGLCAILLRKVLLKDDTSLWPSLSPAVKQTVKAEMLNVIKEEQDRGIVRKVCDCVSELAAGIIEGGEWPELLPFMFQCVQSGQERLMEAALLIFEDLARYVMPQLAAQLATLHEVLHSCLAHPSMDVKLAAFRATCMFIRSLDAPADRDRFQSALPLMLAVVGAALNAADELAAQTAVELLIEVADEHPRFLRRRLPEVADAMLQIAGSEALDEGTRRLAAEFLVTLCEAREKAPGMMRKLPRFVDGLFACCLAFLLDVEDEPAWHTAEDERDGDAGEGELYDFGQQCLDRVALALGGRALVPVAGAALPAMMADAADWRRRHAALICLAQVAEGCAKVMGEEPVSGQLVALCLAGAADAHPRVRWAACQALGQLCTDLGPDLQEAHHAQVLPALMALMDDFASPRVQAHACAATVNFAEATDQDVVAPYLDTLIGKLLALVQSGRRNVQEEALTSLASVADSAGDYFVKYYDTCMPLLRHVLEHARERAHHKMRAKALECISLVGMAVGRERFGADAAAVLQYMQAVQAAGLDPDDPLASYMMQAGARFATALGSDFLPYLPVVMPPLLEAARAQPEIKIHGDTDDEDDEDEEEGEMETFFIEGKRVSLHTEALEEKATACSMLCCYAYELREGFFPYVNEVTQIMVPLLQFGLNEDVRSAAAQALPELLRSAVEAAAKGVGPDEDFLRTMAAFMWPALVDAATKEDELDVLSVMLTSMEEVLDYAQGPRLLPPDQLAPAFAALGGVLSAYEERRAERLERQTGEDFDAEEEEALQEEHEAEGDLLDAASNVFTTALRLYGDTAMPCVEGVMPAVGRLLERGRFPEERRVALCLMDDVIQYSGAGAAKYMAQVMPLLLAGAADRDPTIRQCAVFGLGQAAQHRGEGFRAHAPAAVAAILAIIQAPTARSEPHLAATENAVSALGKVLEFQPDCVDPGAGALYVGALPITEDEVEAKVVHAQLLRFLRASDARVLGEGNCHLAKLVDAMVRVLARGEALVERADAEGMAVLLRQMQGALPGEVFAGYVAALKPKQRATLQAVLEGRPAGSPA